jgi:hypothetical protein
MYFPMIRDYRNYFVWKGPSYSDPFRVVYREVKTRTRKGIPVSYVLKSIPFEYETWDMAKVMADDLNSRKVTIGEGDWIGEE